MKKELVKKLTSIGEGIKNNTLLSKSTKKDGMLPIDVLERAMLSQAKEHGIKKCYRRVAAYELGVTVEDIFNYQKTRIVPKEIEERFEVSIPKIEKARIRLDSTTDSIRRLF